MSITFTVATNTPQSLSEADLALIKAAKVNVAQAWKRTAREGRSKDAIRNAFRSLEAVENGEGFTNSTLVSALHDALKALTVTLSVTTNESVIDQIAVAYSKVLAVRDNNLGPSRSIR